MKSTLSFLLDLTQHTTITTITSTTSTRRHGPTMETTSTHKEMVTEGDGEGEGEGAARGTQASLSNERDGDNLYTTCSVLFRRVYLGCSISEHVELVSGSSTPKFHKSVKLLASILGLTEYKCEEWCKTGYSRSSGSVGSSLKHSVPVSAVPGWLVFLYHQRSNVC